jgi:hypothetical protein
MPAKGHKHAAEALGPGGTISRGTKYGVAKRRWLEKRVRELEAALYAITPRDLALLRESGAMSEAIQRHADVAAAEVLRLRRSAEGEPDTPGYRPLSEGQAAALRVAERDLLLGLCEQARAITADDGDAASRAVGMLSKYLAVVKDAIGLGPREVEVPDLADYLASRAAKNRSSEENGCDPDTLPTDVSACTSRGSRSGEPGPDRSSTSPAAVSTSTRDQEEDPC